MQKFKQGGETIKDPSLEEQLKLFAEIIMDIYLELENSDNENAER